MGTHCPTWQVLHNIYQCLLPEETCQEEPFLDPMLAAKNMESWPRRGKTLAPLAHVLLHHVDGRMLHSDSAAQLVGGSSVVLWVGEALPCPQPINRQGEGKPWPVCPCFPAQPRQLLAGSMQWHGWGHRAELDLR